MNQAHRQHLRKTGWIRLQQVLAALAVLMLVLSPLAGHDDAHAGQGDQHMSISIEMPDPNPGNDETDGAQCCHPAAGCAALVLGKPVAVLQPMTLSLSFRLSAAALWQGRQAEPRLRPPIL